MERITALTILGALGIPVAAGDNVDLAARIAIAERQRDARIQQVRSTRKYTIRNSHWKSDATMHSIMVTSADGSKRYEVLETDADGIRKKILLRIMDGEVEAAGRSDRDGYLNSVNYELRLLPSEPAGNHNCRPVEVVAKKRTRLTLDGNGCIDMNDIAMVRMEGRTAKSISFWIGRAYVAHDFRKVGEFWYSSKTYSTADVKLLGKTELIIEYLDYTITPKTGAVISECRPGVPASEHCTKLGQAAPSAH
jgi:hypothetical protein